MKKRPKPTNAVRNHSTVDKLLVDCLRLRQTLTRLKGRRTALAGLVISSVMATATVSTAIAPSPPVVVMPTLPCTTHYSAETRWVQASPSDDERNRLAGTRL